MRVWRLGFGVVGLRAQGFVEDSFKDQKGTTKVL